MEDARLATADDLPLVCHLARRAIEEQRDVRGGSMFARREARAEPVEPSFETAHRADDAVVIVGTIDRVVVGYGIAHIEELRTGERLAVVEDIFVESEARGVGVGEAVMNLLVEWATTRGCTGIDALVLPGNRESKNFFESFGLTARAIIVHRSLDG